MKAVFTGNAVNRQHWYTHAPHMNLELDRDRLTTEEESSTAFSEEYTEVPKLTKKSPQSKDVD